MKRALRCVLCALAELEGIGEKPELASGEATNVVAFFADNGSCGAVCVAALFNGIGMEPGFAVSSARALFVGGDLGDVVIIAAELNGIGMVPGIILGATSGLGLWRAALFVGASGALRRFQAREIRCGRADGIGGRAGINRVRLSAYFICVLMGEVRCRRLIQHLLCCRAREIDKGQVGEEVAIFRLRGRLGQDQMGVVGSVSGRRGRAGVAISLLVRA